MKSWLALNYLRHLINILTLFGFLTGSTVYGQTDTTDCVSKLDTLTNRQVYILVDSMPEFPGGIQAMFNFIAKNIKYPIHSQINGIVFLSFIVEPDGQLTNKKIRKGIMEPVDKEALAVLDKMPDWTLGTCNGQAVPVEIIIPIKFKLR